MKWIKFERVQSQRNVGTEENPVIEDVLLPVELSCCEHNEEIAKKESYNGEYEIYDDGISEPISEPTQLDRVESQVAYLAMMSGYPEILEV